MRFIFIFTIVLSLFGSLHADGYCQDTLSQLEQRAISLEQEAAHLRQQIIVIQQTKALADDLHKFPSACNGYNVYPSARELFTRCDKAIEVYKDFAAPEAACEYSGHLIRGLVHVANEINAYTWTLPDQSGQTLSMVPLSDVKYQDYGKFRKACWDTLIEAENYAKSQATLCNNEYRAFIQRHDNNNQRGYLKSAERLIQRYAVTPIYDVACYNDIHGNMLAVTQHVIGTSWTNGPPDIEKSMLLYVNQPDKFARAEMVNFCKKVIRRARKGRGYFRLQRRVTNLTNNFQARADQFDDVLGLLQACYNKCQQQEILTQRNRFAKLMIDLQLGVQLKCYSNQHHGYFRQVAERNVHQLDQGIIDYQVVYKNTHSEMNWLKGFYHNPRRRYK